MLYPSKKEDHSPEIALKKWAFAGISLLLGGLIRGCPFWGIYMVAQIS